MAPGSSVRLADAAGARRTVLQIVAPGEVGGLESVVLALSAAQVQRGHNVIVAVVHEPRAGDHPYVAALNEAGVRVIPLILPARAYIAERARVREICEREKPDVVHTHGYRPDILHAAFRFRRSFATATTLHGSSRVGGASTLHEYAQMLLLRRFDAVIAVSRQLADQLRDVWVKPENLHTIANGWRDDAPLADAAEARRHLGLPAGGLVVGWVGRLIPIKGADIFLRAVRHLGASDSTISIIGDGSERGRLEELAREHGLGDRVRFHGSVPDAGRYMKAFDVFVLSSRSEGTPITLLEAMAAGVPVVAASVGGVPDVIGPAEGTLVAPEDPTALADAMNRVIRDRVAAQTRAVAAARKVKESYGTERWVEAHDRVYSQILSRKRKQSPTQR